MPSDRVIPLQPPVLDDPMFGGPGVLALSGLRDVCGTRENPNSAGWYRHHHSSLCNAASWLKTPYHAGLDDWLGPGNLGSLDARASISQPPLSQAPMSSIIPRLSVWGEELPFPLSPLTFAVDYRYLTRARGKLPSSPWVSRLRERFPQGSQLLLTFFGDHASVRALWLVQEFWQAEFLNQFDAVLLPDFSANCTDPLVQTRMGERMHQVFAEEGDAAGHVVIPSIAWADEASLRRQLEMWLSQPLVRSIHLDCHGSNVQREGWLWRWLMVMERDCAPHTHIRWLISGMTAGWAVAELRRIFATDSFHLLTSPSMHLAALRAGNTPEAMSQAYSRRLADLEEFRSGVRTADPVTRPERIPSYAELVSAASAN